MEYLKEKQKITRIWESFEFEIDNGSDIRYQKYQIIDKLKDHYDIVTLNHEQSLFIILELDGFPIRIDYDHELIFKKGNKEENFFIRKYPRSNISFYIPNHGHFTLTKFNEKYNTDFPENWMELTEEDLLMIKMVL